ELALERHGERQEERVELRTVKALPKVLSSGHHDEILFGRRAYHRLQNGRPGLLSHSALKNVRFLACLAQIPSDTFDVLLPLAENQAPATHAERRDDIANHELGPWPILDHCPEDLLNRGLLTRHEREGRLSNAELEGQFGSRLGLAR